MNESSLSGVARVHTNWAAILFLVAAISPLSWAATDTGERLYGEHCASCHAATLRGSAHGAALSGPAFANKWAAASAQSFSLTKVQKCHLERLTACLRRSMRASRNM